MVTKSLQVPMQAHRNKISDIYIYVNVWGIIAIASLCQWRLYMQCGAYNGDTSGCPFSFPSVTDVLTPDSYQDITTLSGFSTYIIVSYTCMQCFTWDQLYHTNRNLRVIYRAIS